MNLRSHSSKKRSSKNAAGYPWRWTEENPTPPKNFLNDWKNTGQKKRLQLEWSKKAEKNLQKIPKRNAFLIRKRCELAAQDWGKKTKQLTNSQFRSIRTGNYRAIIEIDFSANLMKIIKIGHRKNVYKKLGTLL